MSKKNINRILILVVAIIWSILIYQFINRALISNSYRNLNTVSQKIIDVPQIAKDTFNLKRYTRDPFLGTLNNNQRTDKTRKPFNQIKKIETPINQNWPNIEYLGFVKEEKANDPLILIKIDNKFFRKKIGEDFTEGLKVVEFFKDSVLVDFNSEKKIIKKF
ncbi:hypothetical protein [Lacinutrix chionoecetis]